ncbi:MAG: hypothetical protein PF904_02050 [Kiritimatiellae bacterium]|jgi:hypothetical protein|nr:hypothetical protein [Kiritimatiellia bacterium]
MQDESTTENDQESKSSEQRNFKKTLIFAAALFLIPFIIATLMGVIANQLSPVKQKTKAALAAENSGNTNLPVCSATADISELLQYRNAMKESGQAVDLTNIRIWAAAAKQPALLISVKPPAPGKEWSWRLSKDGMHALAIEIDPENSLLKQVALYSFEKEQWVWQNRLPWPESHESPWVFNNTTIIRSSKNNRRFAMEINPEGNIVSIDSLAGDGPFPETEIQPDNSIPGTAIAVRSNVYFIKDSQDCSLQGYALSTVPGLYPAGEIGETTCFSGTGLLKFTAKAGIIKVIDAFTGITLSEKAGWIASSNTVVSALASNRDGSELNLLMSSTFEAPQAVTRKWRILYTPEDNNLNISMTNATSIVKTPPSSTILTPLKKWIINLRSESILAVFDHATGKEVTKVDLKKHINCNGNPILEASLLEGESYILLKQRNRAFLLSLNSIVHYGDLLARLKLCKKNLSEYTEDELLQTNLVDNSMREIESANSDKAADTFNYAMDIDQNQMDPRLLEPPALPSILSLQAEFLATHHAWLYATGKLKQLTKMQENDNRAPRANPLLCSRYLQLSGKNEEAKKVCRKALNSLFYDFTPYNRMIRYQMLKTFFLKGD